MHSQVFIVPNIIAEIINTSAFKKYRNPQQAEWKDEFIQWCLIFIVVFC